MELWTIGHGTRSIEDFLAALRAHGVEVLADVRQFPRSRRNPQFAQPALRAALEAAGLRYEHLVDLGGFRDEGYAAYMASPAWRAAFEQLAGLAREARVAVCCAETVPFRCHRRHIAAHAAGARLERHPHPRRPQDPARARGAPGEARRNRGLIKWSSRGVPMVPRMPGALPRMPEPPFPPGPFPGEPEPFDDDDEED